MVIGHGDIARSEVGEADTPVVDRRDQGLRGRRACGGERVLEPARIRMEVRPPRPDALRLDALLVERVAHTLREGGGSVPVPGPCLDDDLVQEDVAERRVVTLVACLLLGFVEFRSCTVQVVDVPKPLAELEHDAAVDRRRR